MENESKDAEASRQITARVVSSRMDKSASVEITRMVRHRLYGKYVRRRTKLLVHDEANECNEGDVVRISQCRPISRHKSWRVVEIVERAGTASNQVERTDAEEEATQ
ncbi:MAG: 30S ribosomal protein S17 [Gammaproteobacteria bacterium]|nr:30S ribosomal protein S17 [Gammaproteobacteria bacterium]